jgi:hypothetical protein
MLALVKVPPGVQLGAGHPSFHISPLAARTGDEREMCELLDERHEGLG